MNDLIYMNLLPTNLSTRMLITASAIFSLFYCCLAFGEICHVVWNHYHPDYDWQPKKKHQKSVSKSYFPIRLTVEMIIYFIFVICLTIIFPIFHI